MTKQKFCRHGKWDEVNQVTVMRCYSKELHAVSSGVVVEAYEIPSLWV
jgi:hypothetical protein